MTSMPTFAATSGSANTPVSPTQPVTSSNPFGLTAEELQAVQGIFGQDFTQVDAEFVQQEVDAFHARTSAGAADPTGWSVAGIDKHINGLTGFHMPAGMSQNDLAAALSAAEAWTATTGQDFFPTGAMFLAFVQSGAYKDARATANWMTSTWGPQRFDNQPWATTGLSRTGYESQAQQYLDNYEALTGNRNPDPKMIPYAISHGWTWQQLQASMLADPRFVAQFPWVSQGQSFQQMQQTKTALLDSVEQMTGGRSLTGSAADLLARAQREGWNPSRFQQELRQDPGFVAANPWVAQGLSYEQMQQSRQGFLDIYQGLTGTRDANPLIDQAQREGWSSAQFQDTLKNDPTFKAKYGYVQYGYDYQSFQNYKQQNRPRIIARYGANGDTESNYLNDLQTPLQPINASGSGVQQGRASSDSGQSEVR